MPALTAADALAQTARRLAAAGLESPRLEAELLLQAATACSREHLLLHPEAHLSPEQAAALDALVSRREQREPLAYILGEAEFYSLPFRISSSVIVPRPETEILAEAAVARARRIGATLGADVGTGSGILAVVLAREIPSLHLLALDISLPALRLAAENLRRYDLGDRVLPVCADLLSAVGRPLDCIVANLPYIARDYLAGLQPEVRDFEPTLALDGGSDGLGLLRRLRVQLFDHLREGGFTALEVGAGQAGEVANLLLRAGLTDIEILPDYAGIERVVVAWRQG
jgi:release factor glutamine methyltransferase